MEVRGEENAWRDSIWALWASGVATLKSFHRGDGSNQPGEKGTVVG